MYKVIKHFCDLQDKNRPYEVGDTFPHKECGYPVSETRLAELAGNGNKQGVPLIEIVEDKKGKGKGKDADKDADK